MENGHRNSEFSHKTWWFSTGKRWFTGGFSIFQWLRQLANTVANYAQPPILFRQGEAIEIQGEPSVPTPYMGQPPPPKKGISCFRRISRCPKKYTKVMWENPLENPWKTPVTWIILGLSTRLDHLDHLDLSWSQDLILAGQLNSTRVVPKLLNDQSVHHHFSADFWLLQLGPTGAPISND